MGSVFRKTVTKQLPQNAEIFTRKGERFARWKDANGKTRTATVTVPKKGKNAGKTRIIVTSKKFIAKYRDGNGLVVERSTGCRDETAARQVLADLERQAERIKAGVVTASEDRALQHQATPIEDHFSAFVRHLQAKGKCSRPKETLNQLIRVATQCEFRKLGDVQADHFESWLLLQSKEGLSAGRRNKYRGTWLSFCNWCASPNVSRLLKNPLLSVPVAVDDPTRQRRALNGSELQKFLDSARSRPLINAMTIRRGKDKGKLKANLRESTRHRLERLGHERALIYKTYLLTGLRKGELATLEVRQLELSGSTSYLCLHIADEKNRKGTQIPLRTDLADDIRRWLAEKLKELQANYRDRGEPLPVRLPSDTLVFTVPSGLLRILNRDLAFAGIPKVDERGWTIDVYALRHTFGTHLSIAGVAPRTAQSAMRHSNIDLTMNLYTDPKLLDVHGAVESLPALPLNPTTNENEAATGTHDEARKFAPGFAPTTDNSCLSSHLLSTGTPNARCDDDHGKPLQRKENSPLPRSNGEWAMGDLNPRHPPCKGGALAN